MTPNVPDARSRRERLRAATIAEIRSEARALLVEGGEEGVSLRAVARRMGMTPTALYRYVDGHHQLLQLVAVNVHDDLVAALVLARDGAPGGDGSRLLAVARAFRRWALDHPHEFGQVLANPLPAPSVRIEGPLQLAGHRLGQVFADLFAELIAAGRLRIPESHQVDQAVLAAVAEWPAGGRGLPRTVLVLFAQAWTRLYGCVALEVSGQLAWALTDTEPMFELMLREMAAVLGMPDVYVPPR